jgi:hypothetical protein
MTGRDANKERFIPDLLDMKYEYLFRTIGKHGKYSTGLKCFFLILILSIPCLLMNYLTGTLTDYFIGDWGYFVVTVFMGVFLWILIRFQKGIDEKIHIIGQAISPPKREREQEGYEAWMRWKKKVRNYVNWAHTRFFSYKRYYFSVIVGLVCGFIIGLFIIEPEYGWIQQNLLKELYLRAWWIFFGFLAGASFYYLVKGFWAIRIYCKDVVSHEEILPLHPDRTGGLKELGRLSFDLDLIVALPSIGFPIALLGFMQRVTKNIELAIALSALYALTLVFMFFIPISPAHDAMVKAKNDYILKVHDEYRDLHEELLKKLTTKKRIEPEEYSSLSNLYDLYKRIQSMAVWPLDFGTILRFSITSLVPIISVVSSSQLM